jgi:enoyl-CoA hydratase/carnithine racemase
VTGTVIRERLDAGIEVLRLDRPDRRNAMDSGLLSELNAALRELAADESLRVLVVSTTSERALSAGADMAEELDRDGGLARMAAFTELYAAIDAFPVQTVAVCVGNCVGAGAELAIGCDLRVAGDNLKLGWVGAGHGVPVGPARLTPLVGLSRAKELIYTGRILGSAEAEALGLVHAVAPAPEAEAAAVELAGEVAPRELRTIKLMFRALEDSARRIDYENERLMEFQRHGTGLPRNPP